MSFEGGQSDAQPVKVVQVRLDKPPAIYAGIKRALKDQKGIGGITFIDDEMGGVDVVW